jgi:hypothetical protein
MRSQNLLVLLVTVVGGLTSARDFEPRAEPENDRPKLIKAEEESPIVPGRYIVEFTPVSDSHGHILVCKSRLTDGQHGAELSSPGYRKGSWIPTWIQREENVR